MIAMYSRVRPNGLPNGTPCQPSMTCGPDGPTPHRKRLPDMACKVIAVIAAQAGVRAGICRMLVPALIRSVRANTQATGLTASVPVSLTGPDRVEAEPLGLQDMLHINTGMAGPELDRRRELHDSIPSPAR